MWIAIFCALSAVSAVLCLVATVWLARNATRVAALPLARLRSVESRSELTERSLNDMGEELLRLANRFKMQKVRNVTEHAAGSSKGEPDPRTDPEAWRAWKNGSLKPGVFNE